MRVETGSPGAVATSGGTGAVDVQWSAFRPLVPLEGRTDEERREAHRVNVARRKLDLADFEVSLRRHVEAARACRTPDALLALGRPVLPRTPKEAYAARGERADMDALDARFVHAVRDALAELDAIRARLEGRRRPLDVRVEASVGLKVRAGGRELGVEASLPERAVTASAGGTGAAARCVLERSGAARCGATAVGVAVSRGAVESVETRVGPAYGRLAPGSVAAGVVVGRTVGTGATSLRAEAKLGLEVKLLDPETVRMAFSPEDAWARKR